MVALLLGAAYVAGSQLAGGRPPGESQVIVSSGSSGNETKAEVQTEVVVSLEMERAIELPDRKSDAIGLVGRRDGDSLFVDTARVVGVSGPVLYDGPKVEVVATRSTLVYQDVTDIGQGGKVQQELCPASLEDVANGAWVVVWGDKRGDRVVAEVIVFRPPSPYRR